MTRTIRWGILGTGNVAAQFAEGLAVLPDAELVGVASRDAERARGFASRINARKSFGSYAELAADEEVDVVYVATPANRHKDDCRLCLNAGKGVLCEKPFALTADEAREVVSLAREKRLFCMEAMWMRFLPLVQKVRELVASGSIGDVRMLTTDFGVATADELGKWHFDAAQGGGALLDRGVYGLSLALLLLGRPESVAARATLNSRGTDEQVSIVLQYAGGQLATITASMVAQTSNQALIAGTAGRILLHEPFIRPHRVTIFKSPAPIRFDSDANSGKPSAKARLASLWKGGSSEFVARTMFRIRDWLRPLMRRPQSILQPPIGNGYNYEAAEVVRCMRAGELESKIMPLDETVQILELADSVRAQIAS